MKRAFVVGLLLCGTLAFAQSRETRMGVNGVSSTVSYSSVADGGVVVTGTTIACQSASATGTGCVDTAAQTFAGAKTFAANINVGAGDAGVPAITLGTSTSTGFYLQAADSVGLVVRGARSLRFDNNTRGQILGDDDSARLLLSSSTGASLMGSSGAAGINITSSNVSLFGSPTRTQGGIQYNYNSAARPSCTAGIRGTLFYVPGGAGVADTLAMCGKAAADTYSWVTVTTF